MRWHEEVCVYLAKKNKLIKRTWIVLLGCLATTFFFLSTAGATGLNGDATYTEGPNVCGQCHADKLDQWLSHGHSRKLALGTFAMDSPGLYGLSSDARTTGILLPSHDTDVFTWSNVLFVIGASKHWKTRYVGYDGYIITKGGANQYNWETGTFVDYDKDEVKPFDCGPCHTTGYRYPDQGGTAFSGLPGIVGDFAQFNITCEACHGPGAAHAASPSASNIVVDESAALCGRCHTRGDDDNVIIASGGFIKHHEQYPEFLNSPHSAAGLTCLSCHDVHMTRAQGLVRQCEDCHSSEVTEYSGSTMEQAGVTCQDCHMSHASKSAVARGPYEGDVWTHLFRINSSADYDMFNRDSDGNTVSAKNALNLEYACFRCHAGASKAEYAAIGSTGTAYHTIGK